MVQVTINGNPANIDNLLADLENDDIAVGSYIEVINENDQTFVTAQKVGDNNYSISSGSHLHGPGLGARNAVHPDRSAREVIRRIRHRVLHEGFVPPGPAPNIPQLAPANGFGGLGAFFPRGGKKSRKNRKSHRKNTRKAHRKSHRKNTRKTSHRK